MDLPLYLITDELSECCSISGKFSDDSQTFHEIRLYSSNEVSDSGTVYVLPSSMIPNFPEIQSDHEQPPVLIYCDTPTDNIPFTNCIFCRDFSGDFFTFFNRLLKLKDRCDQWDAALTDCNIRNADYKEYMALCFPMFRNPIILYDHDYIITADSRGLHPMPEDTDWINLVTAGYWTAEVRSTALFDMQMQNRTYPDRIAYYYESDRFFHNFALMHLRESGSFYGTICVHEIFTPITRSILFYITHFGLKIYPRLIQETTTALKTQDIVNQFLYSVLSRTKFSEDYIRSRLEIMDWKENNNYCVIAVEGSNDLLQNTYFPKRMQYIFDKCRTIPFKGLQVTVFCLENDSLPKDFPDFINIIRDSVVKCGVSSILNTFSDIANGYEQAAAALEIGNLINPTSWMYEYKEYGLNYILKFAMEKIPCQILCHPAVLTLQREDRENATSYLDTLAAYLTCEKNVKKIAEQLFIHRNTLMYRLEKIASLTGINYNNIDEMEYILLSIRILRLQEADIFTPKF
nr:helix-turn-helix domain-containing protein [uncultured Blautia sp.]